MPRTRDDEVQQLVEVDADLNLASFIATASSIVDDLEEEHPGKLSTAKLALVESWLAAHFYSLRDQQYSSKSIGGASGSFQGQTGMGFSSTFYGQTAMRLDRTGYLAKLDKEATEGGKRKIQLEWLGTDED